MFSCYIATAESIGKLSCLIDWFKRTEKGPDMRKLASSSVCQNILETSLVNIRIREKGTSHVRVQKFYLGPTSLFHLLVPAQLHLQLPAQPLIPR